MGQRHCAGITSAQHPWPGTPKAVHDSYLPAIIRTASPNLHIEPRRRSNQDKEPGALSLSPATSRISPHPGSTYEATTPAPVAQWIEQAPSKRLAAGSSPAGGASLRPPSGRAFLLLRAVSLHTPKPRPLPDDQGEGPGLSGRNRVFAGGCVDYVPKFGGEATAKSPVAVLTDYMATGQGPGPSLLRPLRPGGPCWSRWRGWPRPGFEPGFPRRGESERDVLGR